ncbi:MAG: sigma 54-interacting transcriptional regulator, partial [Nitrospirota bacterium]
MKSCGHSSCVLLISDTGPRAASLEAVLRSEGYGITVARGYEEALEKLSSERVSLILLDLAANGSSHAELLRAMHTKQARSAVLTSSVEADGTAALDPCAREPRRANLEAVFRSVRDGIVTVQRERRVLELNEAACRLFGLRREEVLGRELDALPFEGCKGKVLEALARCLERQETVELHRMECLLRGKQRGRVVDVTISPLLDGGGALSGAVVVMRDETRLALLERDTGQRKEFEGMVGMSRSMQRVYALVEDLADLDTTVLITGESGTGKELVAEALHARGGRAQGPLVRVNCTALAENLLESELFGHVKGAFTGAVADREGRFERAHGGTILLDEVGDISPGMQMRLLRVLQHREFERVGDPSPRRVDVRVVAATNRDLKEKVRKGEFREDLYYRLKVVEIHLPPLRERREDIPLLVEHFTGHFNRKLERAVQGVSDEVRRLLAEHAWPGNVRELEHALEHAVILARSEVLTLEDLPQDL